MWPKLFGFLPVYGLFFATAVLVSWGWFARRARALGVADEHTFNLCFYALIAGILGAKLTLVLVDLDLYVEDPWRLVGTLRSAGVVIGGLLAGSLAFIYYARRHGLPLFKLGDAVAAPLALGEAIGRLGCLAAGCCWGVHAREGNPFAIVFTDPQAITPELGVPLVPTQLLHFGANLLLAALLSWLWRQRIEPPGTTFWLYMLLYGVTRSTIEIWRGDAARGLYFGGTVSTSQILSTVAVAFAAWMLVRDRVQVRRFVRSKG